MAFAQVYYTSCENGLSDFAGFQFNAATPGLAPQVLREVEALTSYEPPRSLGYRPSSAEIAACPVNLVYRCEPTTVLANVVFVGLDFSQRLGNYFAHALVGQSGTDRFDRILPIELWGSPVWAAEPIAARELPALTDLPDLTDRPDADPPDDHRPSTDRIGSDRPDRPDRPDLRARRISRAGVDRFLADHARPEQLAALVSAAESAILRQGRSIVIIEADSTAAAHWIGAISFLLPPLLARRMSFATYRHRPEYSDAHVIATLPDSDFDLDDSTFHSYVVFDAGSGRISEVSPEPAARLLVRAGAEGADELWQRATTLTDISALTLAECRPVLVAAAVLGQRPVSDDDLDALGGWLASNPAGLAPGDRAPVLEKAIGYLAALVDDDPDAVIEIFAGRLGVLIEDGGRLSPALHRAALLARCRRDLLRPSQTPGPNEDRQVRDWLVPMIVEPNRDGPYLPAYLALCRAIEDGTVTGSLPGTAQLAVKAFLTTIRELEQTRTESDQVRASTLWRLAGSYPQQSVIVQDLLGARLPGLIDDLADSAHLVEAVVNCPHAVITSYLEHAADRAARTPPAVDATVPLFRTLLTLRAGKDMVIAPALDETLRHGLRGWPADQLDRLSERLRDHDLEAAISFDEWRAQHLGGLLSRARSRLGRLRSGR